MYVEQQGREKFSGAKEKFYPMSAGSTCRPRVGHDAWSRIALYCTVNSVVAELAGYRACIVLICRLCGDGPAEMEAQTAMHVASAPCPFESDSNLLI